MIITEMFLKCYKFEVIFNLMNIKIAILIACQKIFL